MCQSSTYKIELCLHHSSLLWPSNFYFFLSLFCLVFYIIFIFKTLTNIGCPAGLSQNMFFTGTNSTMIPLTSEAVTMGVSNVQNAVRTPPTLWQYPSKYPIIIFFQFFSFFLQFLYSYSYIIRKHNNNYKQLTRIISAKLCLS